MALPCPILQTGGPSGAALAGATDPAMFAGEAYLKPGIRAFHFSGYPHLE